MSMRVHDRICIHLIAREIQMRKLSTLLFSILALCATTQGFAKSYQQKIRLHLTSDEPSLMKHACFSTTDYFDKIHCGDGAQNTYKHGPKTVKFGSDKLRSVAGDGCTKHRFRTPKHDGVLDIYARVAYHPSYDFQWLECHSQWTNSH